jgi:hypothetical protein
MYWGLGRPLKLLGEITRLVMVSTSQFMKRVDSQPSDITRFALWTVQNSNGIIPKSLTTADTRMEDG